MIPDTLLIQVDPIRWIGGFSWMDVLISACMSLIMIGIYRLIIYIRKQRKQKHERSMMVGILPDICDADFSLRASALMRQYISIIYLPKKSRAHTKNDIMHYVDDDNIIHALDVLEKSEYSHDTPLNEPEKNKIREILISLQEKIKNPSK